jgi:hypothetical protein
MSSWEDLDGYLKNLTRQVGGEAYIFSDSGKLVLSAEGHDAPWATSRFERAFATVEAEFGKDCLRRGSWRRRLHHEPNNWFLAEPVIKAYHLIVLFQSDYASDEWIARVLDKARPILAEIVVGLPPLDGGRRALSAKNVP